MTVSNGRLRFPEAFTGPHRGSTHVDRRASLRASAAVTLPLTLPGVAGAATRSRQPSGIVWSHRDRNPGTQRLFDVLRGPDGGFTACGYGTPSGDPRTLVRVTDRWGRPESQRRGPSGATGGTNWSPSTAGACWPGPTGTRRCSAGSRTRPARHGPARTTGPRRGRSAPPPPATTTRSAGRGRAIPPTRPVSRWSGPTRTGTSGGPTGRATGGAWSNSSRRARTRPRWSPSGPGSTVRGGRRPSGSPTGRRSGTRDSRRPGTVRPRPSPPAGP